MYYFQNEYNNKHYASVHSQKSQIAQTNKEVIKSHKFPNIRRIKYIV